MALIRMIIWFAAFMVTGGQRNTKEEIERYRGK